MLAWFGQNDARLTFIKKSYLEDPTIYNDGGGQEKQNFRVRLIVKIVDETPLLEIIPQEFFDSLDNLDENSPSAMEVLNEKTRQYGTLIQEKDNLKNKIDFTPLEVTNEIFRLREEALQSRFGGESWYKLFHPTDIFD